MNNETHVQRREFIRKAIVTGAAVAGVPLASGGDPSGRPSRYKPRKKIKVGVIGCGSVSRSYLPNLIASPFVELVSCCDIIYDRAKRTAVKHHVPHHYPHIDEMLAGAGFDLLVNLTDMQEHYRLNKQAIQAGKHVWSEKPMAGNYEEGKRLLELANKQSVCIWAAPTVVTSPQFAFMARTIASGVLGRISAAHASYGHLGPTWSPFFYEKGGGSLPDLGVYNIATLTGLLGPVKEIVAMTSIVTATRRVAGKPIKVEAEDNAMLIMDHGNSVLSHVQCGFNYFSAHDHAPRRQDHHTVAIIGSSGSMHLAGYDWAPHGVDLATDEENNLRRHASDPGEYSWQYGASYMSECLATGRDSLITPEHALHMVDLLAAVNESQRTGRRINIKSKFKWPIVT